MSDFISFLRHIPFIYDEPEIGKGNIMDSWADWINDPPDGWRVPDDRKAIRSICDEMENGGYISIVDIWGEPDGIHMHHRVITTVSDKSRNSIITRRFVAGSVLRWELIKDMLEDNELDIGLFENEEKEDEEVMIDIFSVAGKYEKHPKWRVVLSFRWMMLRSNFIVLLHRILQYFGRRIAPELYVIRRIKNDSKN